MLHQGQTLYVAAGDGDIQLFDVSAWLDGNFREPVTLKKYFAVPGAVRSIALSRGVMYAGSAYVYVDGQPAENPLEVGAEPTSAGGAISTLTDGGLTILEQIPLPRGWLTRDQAIEIQFNRILDQGQLDELAQSLFAVQRSGVPVAVYPSHQINALGSRIFLRPVAPWLDQAEYSVLISAAVADIHGNTLGRAYRFRFAAADDALPRIDRIEPPLGSWRGGTEITIYGANFNEFSRVEIGGLAVPAAQVHNPSQTQLVFTLPRLEPMPVENRWVGAAVSNGSLRTFRAGQITYVADPRIDAIGHYEPATNNFQPTQDRLRFNAGEYVGPGRTRAQRPDENLGQQLSR